VRRGLVGATRGVRYCPLAQIGIEADLVFEAEVACRHAKYLGSAATGEDQSEDDGAIAETGRSIGNDRQKAADFLGREPARGRSGGPRPFQPLARVGPDDIHADMKPEERR